MKMLNVVAAVIEKDGKILIAQRSKGRHAGLWEFPGGKVETGESDAEALKREIKEELDVEIDIISFLAAIKHQYDDFFLVMNCFICSIKSGDLSLHDHLAYRWIDSDAGVDWVEADVKVFEEYKKSKVSPRI